MVEYKIIQAKDFMTVKPTVEFANFDGLMICTFTDYEQAISWIQSEGGLEDL
jgi:hypothetical protein